MAAVDVDVIVVGAGISGIGAAYHLQTRCPDRTFVVLDGRGDLGGTWDLFRYPGVRSDSDMHTLGYSFKPWVADKAIADGPSILAYLRETVQEFGLERYLRFHHRVLRASWSSEHARWTVHAHRADTGDDVTMTCRYLFMCSGYYSYDGGYTPEFPGLAQYEGTVVHPQAWPDDLDHTGKRVVVIGSGATAVTLVPAMAERAEHVTMLQRSPTYVVARPDVDPVANVLRRVLPAATAYELTRRKNVALGQFFYRRTRTHPDRVKRTLLGMVARQVGDDYTARHFTPTYGPWDQRLCLVPNGDLFTAIRSGRASVVTDTIDTFTPTGIRLASGRELRADIVVTATGLQLVTLGRVAFDVDGAPVDFARTWTYKGFAYSGVPNLASSFGYINASWTLRADLICEVVCRLLQHMAATDTQVCTPTQRPDDDTMPARPYITDFSPGYMAREMHRFPKQGDRVPWTNPQDYAADRRLFRESPVDDGVMRFTRVPTVVRTAG